MTLTHYWMKCQGLIVLVICNLPLAAKYSKPFQKWCTNLLLHYTLKYVYDHSYHRLLNSLATMNLLLSLLMALLPHYSQPLYQT